MFDKLWMIMFFYAFLSYFLGPFLGKKWKNDINGFQTGMLEGILVSLGLWFWKGKDYFNVSSLPEEIIA